MSATTLIEFDDLTEHTFDALLMKLANDKGQLKEQFLSSEILFSNYDKDGDLVSKRGTKTLVLSGADNTGQVLGGVLDFPNQDASIATYAAITDVIDDFSFRVKINMNVTAIVVDRDLVKMVSNIDNSLIRFYLENNGGGLTRIKRQIIDSTGGITSNVILIIKNFSIDPIFDISFSNDDDGNTLTYINGVLLSTIASPAFDFTDFDFVLGDSVEVTADFDNVQIWKAIIDLAVGIIAPEDTTFNLNENKMLTVIPFLLDEIISFTIINEIPSNTQLKHFLVLNLDQIYHDGTDWVESDGTLAQANTVTEISDNLASLPIVKGIGKILQIAHVFKSDIGYDTPLIESLTIQYKFQFKPDNVKINIIFGTIVDNAGVPVVGATVRVDSPDIFYNGAFKGPTAKASTNAQGKFTLGIIETISTSSTVDIFVEYSQKKLLKGVEFTENIVFEYKDRIIPDLPTTKLSDLVTP